MVNLLILTLIVLVTSVANAFIDAHLIKINQGKIDHLDHWSRDVIRFVIFVIAIYYLFDYTLFKPFLAGFYCWFLFSTSFDPLLNYLRGLPWYYEGQDALTDRVERYIRESVLKGVATTILVVKLLIILGLGTWILLI